MSKIIRTAIITLSALTMAMVELTNFVMAQDVDPALYENMEWRDLGFSRDGRSSAVAMPTKSATHKTENILIPLLHLLLPNHIVFSISS